MSAPLSDTYSIVCDRIYDPVARAVRCGRMAVRGGHFGTFQEHVRIQPGAGEHIFDLRGLTMLPSAVDAHVHLSLDPWPLAPSLRAAPPAANGAGERAEAQARLRETFLSGVGLVRDLGDPHGINLSMAAAAEHADDLPRVLTSGPGLHRKGRYGRFIGLPFANRSDLLRAVRQRLAPPGVHLLKLIVTGIINFKRGAVTAPPQFELDELKAAVELAHDLGKRVAAHASGEDGVRMAVEAGVDFVEHAYFISKETMELLAARKLVWTPTFLPVHAQWARAEVCGWDKAVREHLRRILDGHALMLRHAMKLGVRVLPGSDAGGAGVAHGGGLWDELRLLHEAGASIGDLLETATVKARAWLLERPPNSPFAPGCPADYIAVEGELDRDLGAAANLRWVARDGRVWPARRPRSVHDPEAVRYGLPESAASCPG